MDVIQSVIAATGSYLPEKKVLNNEFLQQQFLKKDGRPVPGDNLQNIEKFKEITGISERRYAKPDQIASQLAYLAALEALESGDIDKETLDYIIVAHNFGDVAFGSRQTDMLPSLASKVKYQLQVKNPSCVSYDLLFGCPGWLQGVIQADYYIRSGDAKRCLVIGAETLSRVIDEYDRDSMIYADGAGAVVLEAASNSNKGILSHLTQTFASDHALLLAMNKTYNPESQNDELFLKMNGRSVYEFALNYVPLTIKQMLDKAQISITEVKKVLIHQANDKMDRAILQRLFNLYNIKDYPANMMPMTISWLGNSSVATIPTLLDLLQKNKMNQQNLQPGDKVVFASVGAGMNINALLYQF